MAEIIQRYLFNENGEVVGYEYRGRLVRCEDCEYRSEKAFRSVDGDVVEYNYCSQWNRDSNINGYCYKGERKDEVKE